jgi:predicted nucleotidyltransferase
MFQIRNDYEIVALLQKEPKHLRKIAKELNVPLTNVMRLSQNLVEENVLDFREIGKSKQFFLKNTLESQVYQHMAEHYKKLKVLQRPLIRKIVQEVLDIVKGNQLIVLFGSYAKGLENKDSDIDLYVETKSTTLKKKLESISDKLSIKIGEFNKDSALAKEIIKNHVIIQNVERYFDLLL